MADSQYNLDEASGPVQRAEWARADRAAVLNQRAELNLDLSQDQLDALALAAVGQQPAGGANQITKHLGGAS